MQQTRMEVGKSWNAQGVRNEIWPTDNPSLSL